MGDIEVFSFMGKERSSLDLPSLLESSMKAGSQTD
jgi:hypothetical protein